MKELDILENNSEELNFLSKTVLVLTTFYDNSENSELRYKLALKTINNALKLGLNVFVVDNNSINKAFLEGIEKLKNGNLLFITSNSLSLGEQTRKALYGALNCFSEAHSFLRIEPEKYTLLLESNLIPFIKFILSNPGKKFYSPTRKTYSETPIVLKFVERAVGKQINGLLNFDNSIELSSEGPGSLFGPVLIPRISCTDILRTEFKSWNTWFIPRLTSFLEGQSVYFPVDFRYDKSEIDKEYSDMKILYKKIKNNGIDINKLKELLRNGNVEEFLNILLGLLEGEDLKNNLVIKRCKQYLEMKQILSDTILDFNK